MVLQGGPCGRVGHRRTSFEKWPPNAGWPFHVNAVLDSAGEAPGRRRDGRRSPLRSAMTLSTNTEAFITTSPTGTLLRSAYGSVDPRPIESVGLASRSCDER